jgi:flagellar biosynthesis protein FlhG
MEAAHLRRLVLHSGLPPEGADQNPPRRLVVSSGKLAQGSTTLAVNLAVALATHGSRTVLLDADFARADVAAHCGLADSPGIAEVLTNKKSIHEVLQRGPGGIQVMAGAGTIAARNACSERALDRLQKQIAALGRYADTVVIDAGCGSAEPTIRFWSEAEDVLLVTTPDAVAVMDTYATLKTMLSRSRVSGLVQLVVNQAESEAQAIDVHRRIEQSCQRFLGMSVPLAGWIRWESTASQAARAGQPLTIKQPASQFAAAVDRLAERLLGSPVEHAPRRAA